MFLPTLKMRVIERIELPSHRRWMILARSKMESLFILPI